VRTSKCLYAPLLKAVYGHYVIGSNRDTVLSNFLQPVITTWWTCELVELAAVMLDFDVRLGEITNALASMQGRTTYTILNSLGANATLDFGSCARIRETNRLF
jgi:hypothetical protein